MCQCAVVFYSSISAVKIAAQPWSTSVCRFQDGARKNALMEDNNNLMSCFYDDAKTLYEIFQRGRRVSGKHVVCFLL